MSLFNWMHRMRGNPLVLSSILIPLVLVLVALLILVSDLDMLDKNVTAGALLGAAASAFATLLIRILAEPDLREVPRTFLKAARQDVHDTGYYCRDCRLTVELGAKKGELLFSYSSTIVPVRSKIQMRQPKVEAPKGLSLASKDYRHDNNSKPEDADIPVDKPVRETCEIKYKIQNNTITIEDEHRWRCPTEGFELIVKLPPGYKTEAFTLRAGNPASLDEVNSHMSGERIFICRETLFSYQGFRWTIIRNTGTRDRLSGD